MNQEKVGSISVLSSLFIFSTMGIAVKLLKVNPFFLVQIYSITACCMFFLFSYLKGENILKDKNVFSYFLVAFFLSIDLVLLFFAYSYTTMSNTIFLHFVGPVWIILMTSFRDRNSKMIVIALELLLAGLSLAGVYLIFSNHNDKGEQTMLGNLFAFLSSFTLAGNVMTQKNASSKNDIFVVGFYYMLFMSLILVVFNIVFFLYDSSLFATQVSQLKSKLLYIVACGILYLFGGTYLYNTGVKKIPVRKAGLFGYFEVLTVSVWGVCLFKEQLTLHIVIGSVLILCANFTNFVVQRQKICL